MGLSEFGLTGRFFAGVFATALLAGVSVDASAYGNKGVVRLQLGKPGVADGFYLEKTDGTSSYQYFLVPKKTKCIADLHNWVQPVGAGGEPKIVGVHAIGPGNTDDPKVGLVTGSLGVYDNSNGTSCGQISVGEALVLDSLKGGFDRLELDMELKGNAVFRLTINPGSPNGHVYTLYSGTSQQVGLDGVELPAYWDAKDSTAQTRNCVGSSDSGPDSGPSDNCRWIINDVGSSFKLEPLYGYGSLEGGGDYVGTTLPSGWTTADTLIYLTSLIDVGTLGCDSTNNQTAEVFADDASLTAASCRVTRINPSNLTNGECTGPVDYRLETFTFDSKCQLDKTGGPGVDDQFAGSMTITFEPEESWPWGSGETEVTFACAPEQTDEGKANYCKDGQTKPLLATRCFGTVGPDANDNPTIEEMLSDPASLGAEDQVKTTPQLDWACVLDHREVYQGPITDPKMQVIQTMLFWGDFAMSRQ